MGATLDMLKSSNEKNNYVSYRNILILLVCMFFIGWGKFLLEGPSVYFVDYALRISILLVFFLTFRTKPLLEGHIISKNIFYGVVLFSFCITVDQLFYGTPWEAHFDVLLFKPLKYPKIDNDFLLAFDLSVGLILVGLSEEGVFRVLFSKLAIDGNWSVRKLYGWSSFWFAVIHLPQGLTHTVSAGIFGLLFMYFYRRTGSFLYVAIAHTMIDIWFFGSWYYWYGNMAPIN